MFSAWLLSYMFVMLSLSFLLDDKYCVHFLEVLLNLCRSNAEFIISPGWKVLYLPYFWLSNPNSWELRIFTYSSSLLQHLHIWYIFKRVVHLTKYMLFFLELKEPHVSILFATWSFLLHVWLYKANSCCYDKHLRGEREWREIYYNSQFVPVVTWSHDARSLWMSKLPHDGQEAERIGNQKPLSTFKNEHSIYFFFTFYPFTFPPLFKMLPVANNQEFNTWASADISYSNDYILPLFSKSLWLPHNVKCIYSIQKSLQS